MENQTVSRPKAPPMWAVDAAKWLSKGLSRVQRKLAPASASLLELVSAAWRPHAIWVVAELGIADHLEAGPLSVAELAKRTSTNADALARVLRPLAHDGILAMPERDTFALTALSQPLRSSHPSSMRQTVRQSLSSWNRASWSELLESVRTGEPAFPRLHGGKDLWSWFAAENPDAGKVFHDSMGELTRLVGPLLVAGYDFGQHGRILDLGGGNGMMIATILKSFPQLRGGVLDLPATLAEAPRMLEAAAVRERVELISGNAFDAVPSGWDGYILKHILHGVKEPQIGRILGNIRDAMQPGSKLFVIEMLIPEDQAGIYPAFIDLQMLVSSGGRERSVPEYRELFAKHGLTLDTVIRTASIVSMLVVSRA